MGVLIITHHERLLEFNQPQYTHVMLAGRIVETGDAALAHELHDQRLCRRPRAAPRRSGRREGSRQKTANRLRVQR